MAVEILREREAVGVTLEALAEYAEVEASELAEWERSGGVPRAYRAQVKWALWAARRDVLLENSELSECEWIQKQEDDVSDTDPKIIAEHLNTCEICVARSKYVEEHVGPMPAMGSGVLMWTLAHVDRFSGWKRSAVAGALLLLAMAGIGVVILLGIGLVNLDLGYILQAFGLFIVLVVGGAAGGITYHAASPLRQRGGLGYYGASILTVYGYLLGVLGMITLATTVVGWEAIDPELGAMLTDPVGWVVAAILGVFFGVVLGRAMRD